MELPHLTMHLRQIGRSSARGTWLIIVVVAVLITLCMVWKTAVTMISSHGLYHLGSVLLGIFVVNFLLYWVIAQQMAALACDARGHPPEWHSAPLSNSAALAGIMARTGLAALVPLGLLASFHFFEIYTFMFDAQYYWTAFGLQVLRLPAFVLFAGCLQLALRRSGTQAYLPMVIATIAALCEFWNLDLVLHQVYFPEDYGRAIALLGLLIGFGVQFALALWLIWLSSRERAGLGHYAIVLLVLGGAGALVVLSMVGSFSAVSIEGLLSHTLFIPLVGTLSNIFPSLCAIRPAPAYYGDQYYMITWMTSLPLASAILAAAYIVAIPVWWRATIGCLRAARHPVEARWTK